MFTLGPFMIGKGEAKKLMSHEIVLARQDAVLDIMCTCQEERLLSFSTYEMREDITESFDASF